MPAESMAPGTTMFQAGMGTLDDLPVVKEGVQPADILNGVKSSNGIHSALNGKTETNGHGNGVGHANESKKKRGWNIRRNPLLEKCDNPIRKIVDPLAKGSAVRTKDFISLSQGDPVAFGPHMNVPDVASNALVKAVEGAEHNGYPSSFGHLSSRSVLAEYLSGDGPYTLTSQDVILTSGAAHALSVAMDAFRFPGCNILLPRPGFSLYESLCHYFNIEIRFYDLLQDKNWEVDLQQLAALADENTVAMILCNPGNPSGSVFSYEHLSEIATVAGESKMCIIADEVYFKMVFGDLPFVSMATFSNIAPVLALGSISKAWLATGWRLGWIALWDPQGILKEGKYWDSVLKILQISASPAGPIQAALPEMLMSTPDSFYQKTCTHLRLGAEFCYARLNSIHGLSVPTVPTGSMFMMVKIDLAAFHDIPSDAKFSEMLLKEESVLVLPGIAFGIPNWFRIVFALTLSQMGVAFDRMEKFCERHALQ